VSGTNGLDQRACSSSNAAMSAHRARHDDDGLRQVRSVRFVAQAGRPLEPVAVRGESVDHEDVDADDDERPERVGLDGGQGGDPIDGGDGNPEPARKLVRARIPKPAGTQRPLAARSRPPCNQRRLECVMPSEA
jgi:hypothetical protein